MSIDAHQRNTSPAHGLDQSNDIFHIRSRPCCTCAGIVAISVNDICKECSNTNFISARHGWNLYEAAQRVGSALSEHYITTTPQSNQSPSPTGHEESDPEGEGQNEANKEQEHGMRPRGEPPEEQQSWQIPGRNKRKLNMVKCERCRTDKKCCNWKSSEKCDRCIEKGFPCSERTRVIRPRKHAPKHVSPVHNDASPSANSDLFKERFEKWAFLRSYHRMMTMATDRLERLEEDAMRTFYWDSPPFLFGKTARREFEIFVYRVQDAFDQALAEVTTTENDLEAFVLPSLTRSQRLVLIVNPLDALYPYVCPAYLRPTMNKAVESLDICGAFLVQQHELQTQAALDSRELERYTMFSTKIPLQAEAILGSSNLSDFGLYHLDVQLRIGIQWQLKSIDCLGRTPFHRYLDRLFEWVPRNPSLPVDFSDELIEMSWWNSQDILGRTPLHILCQFRNLYFDDVKFEIILRAGANPGLKTIYGSLPLHYAAASGSLRSCELLIKHKSKFNIGARDKCGYSALDYAIIKNAKKVADFLTDHYKEAGLDREIRKALTIKKHLEEDVVYYPN